MDLFVFLTFLDCFPRFQQPNQTEKIPGRAHTSTKQHMLSWTQTRPGPGKIYYTSYWQYYSHTKNTTISLRHRLVTQVPALLLSLILYHFSISQFSVITLRWVPSVPIYIPASFRFLKGDILDFSIFFRYDIQHCFICRPSDSNVSEDAGIEPGQLLLRHWLSDAPFDF